MIEMKGLNDLLYYTLIGNPISSGAVNCAKTLTNAVGLTSSTNQKMSPPQIELHKLASMHGPYVRLAAFSGAAAVILGAYGSHRNYNIDSENNLDSEHRQKAFETANKYHFIHTLALLGMPLAKNKFIPATLFMSGIILFCGSCYYYAFTNDKKYNKLTPVGGTCLILGWLGMIF